MTKTTLELQVGDIVRVARGIVREVAAVRDSGYVNQRNRPLYVVEYAEGGTGRWSGGNMAAAQTTWDMAEQCDWNRGADPASGCDDFADREDGLCATHRETLRILESRRSA